MAGLVGGDGKLIAIIGDEDTVTGFVLAGVGHRTADPGQQRPTVGRPRHIHHSAPSEDPDRQDAVEDEGEGEEETTNQLLPNGLQQGTLVVGGVDYSQYINPEGEDCQLGDTYELVEEDEEHNANKSTISASAKGNEQNDAPDDGEEEDDDEEDEEVEVEELVIDGKTYYTDDSKNGSLFEYLEDGEIGDIVGHLENGSGFFLTI